MKRLESQSSEENISPNKGTLMMKNWLAKASSSKKTDKSVVKKNGDSPIKTHDSNKMEKKAEKLETIEKTKKPTKKIIDSEEEEEEEEEKPIKKQTKATKTKKKVEDFDDDDEDYEEIKSSKSASKKSKSTTEKADLSTTTGAKKPGNKYYAAYMRREGPKNPGSKRIPIGKKNCFEGLKFLITGVLDSIDRDECKCIVEKYGGSVVSGVTKKLDYLIVGEDAGEAKLSKADELNIKKINEDEFLELICKKSGITNPKYEDDDQQMNVDEEESEPAQEKVEVKKKGLIGF
jgi:replication factor C subunit 1